MSPIRIGIFYLFLKFILKILAALIDTSVIVLFYPMLLSSNKIDNAIDKQIWMSYFWGQFWNGRLLWQKKKRFVGKIPWIQPYYTSLSRVRASLFSWSMARERTSSFLAETPPQNMISSHFAVGYATFRGKFRVRDRSSLWEDHEGRVVPRSNERDRPASRRENDDATECFWLFGCWFPSGQKTGDFSYFILSKTLQTQVKGARETPKHTRQSAISSDSDYSERMRIKKKR